VIFSDAAARAARADAENKYRTTRRTFSLARHEMKDDDPLSVDESFEQLSNTVSGLRQTLRDGIDEFASRLDTVYAKQADLEGRLSTVRERLSRLDRGAGVESGGKARRSRWRTVPKKR
jgi:hypothetical protein